MSGLIDLGLSQHAYLLRWGVRMGQRYSHLGSSLLGTGLALHSLYKAYQLRTQSEANPGTGRGRVGYSCLYLAGSGLGLWLSLIDLKALSAPPKIAHYISDTGCYGFWLGGALLRRTVTNHEVVYFTRRCKRQPDDVDLPEANRQRFVSKLGEATSWLEIFNYGAALMFGPSFFTFGCSVTAPVITFGSVIFYYSDRWKNPSEPPDPGRPL